MRGQNVVKEEFEKLVSELIEKHDALGMRASGGWADSLEASGSQEGTKVKGQIKGERYTEQLQFGRRPGKFPPLRAIEQWIRVKKIQSSLPIKSLVFLISRKIAEKGTGYFQQGGTGLVSSVITDNRIDEIISKVGLINTEGTISGFVEDLKRVDK